MVRMREDGFAGGRWEVVVSGEEGGVPIVAEDDD